MDTKTILILLLQITVFALAPLLGALFTRLFPVTSLHKDPSLDSESLHRRNNWIDLVACTLCVASFGSAVLLYVTVLDDNDPLGVGLGFGMAVIAPLLWITLVTLPSGVGRFREFWRFYQLKYELNWIALLLLFTPFVVLGGFSIYVLAKRLLVHFG